MKPKTITLLIILALFFVVLTQNADPIALELFFWAVHLPLFVLIISVLALGLLVGWFARLAYEKGKRASAKGAPAAMEPTTGKEPDTTDESQS